MNIQQMNPQMISITDLRRDVDCLQTVLQREEVAWVMKNQDVMFVAVKPEKFQAMTERLQSAAPPKKMSMDEVFQKIDGIRDRHVMPKEKTVSSYVAKMRDERIEKWIKK